MALIPGLRRFYGGQWQEWIEMPGWLLEIHLEEMPKIMARESLSLASSIALGSGGFRSEEDAREYRRGLIADAEFKSRHKIPKSKESLKENLSASGIGYAEA